MIYFSFLKSVLGGGGDMYLNRQWVVSIIFENLRPFLLVLMWKRFPIRWFERNSTPKSPVLHVFIRILHQNQIQMRLLLLLLCQPVPRLSVTIVQNRDIKPQCAVFVMPPAVSATGLVILLLPAAGPVKSFHTPTTPTSTKVNQLETYEIVPIHTLKTRDPEDKIFVNLLVDGKTATLEADSGSRYAVMSKANFKKLHL